jgi:hypothetical protein
VGIFESSGSVDYIFGANILFLKPRYSVDNSLFIHPYGGGIYLHLSNKVGINFIKNTSTHSIGPLLGVDFKILAGDGSIIFIGPNIGFYFYLVFGDTVKISLHPSIYINPTWYLGSIWGESDSGYVSTNVKFDFKTTFYFRENLGIFTDLLMSSGGEFPGSLYYITFGPSFSF